MLFENRIGCSAELLDDLLIVRREQKGSHAQERRIAYSQISAVQFREADIASGYIQFCTGKRAVGSLAEALSDETTILFARDLNAEFALLRDRVEQRIGTAHEAPAAAPGDIGKDRLGRLERLERLKAAGVLDEGEFEAEKSKILSVGTPPEQPSTPWVVPAVLLGLVLFGAIMLGSWSGTKDDMPTRKPSLPSSSASEPLDVQPPSPPVPVKTAAERLSDAFEAATGHRTEFTELEDGNAVMVRPVRLVTLPFGEALLTRREISDGCHACVGSIGVYYLKPAGDHVEIAGSWPKAVEGWGWGAAPADWHFTSKFTANPAIYASGSYMGQGVIESSATITELTPTGPVTSVVIGTDFDDQGAIIDNERGACIVKGEIANIVRDRSFDVVATGSINAVDHYVKRDGKFVAANRLDWGTPCDS